MNKQNITKHLATLGFAITKIDTHFSETENIPADELVKQYKRRQDYQDAAGFFNFVLASTEQKEKEEAKIITLDNGIK